LIGPHIPQLIRPTYRLITLCILLQPRSLEQQIPSMRMRVRQLNKNGWAVDW
jgi:hypothetical protein